LAGFLGAALALAVMPRESFGSGRRADSRREKPASPEAVLPDPGKGYPIGPNPGLTPGSLCERPTTKRYFEGIPYCARDVDSDVKREVMAAYDRELGFKVLKMDRGAFKIDHFIPLCMGGSNQPSNLWPQHESVYVITDLLEAVSCDKMAQGKLLQADAVAGIREAKLNLSKAQEILQRVRSL
jgi:hypothetical protein